MPFPPPAMWETWVWSLGREDSLEILWWLPTSVFQPGEFHGLYSPWGCEELDTTESTFTLSSKRKRRKHSLLMNKQYLKSLLFGKSYKIICSGGGGDLVAKLCLTLATPWTIACQAPLAIGVSRQEYWSRLPFPSPGDLPEIIRILW